MEDTLELKSGRVLHLRPVRQAALRHLLVNFGRPDLLDAPEKILAANTKAQFKALEATERLFTYLAGWGVTDDPSEDELETIAELGYPADKPHLARANWLRYLVLDDDEMSDLIAMVMALTHGTEEQEKPEQEDATEQ